MKQVLLALNHQIRDFPVEITKKTKKEAFVNQFRAVLKKEKTSVRPPSAVRQCPSPSDSPPTDGPTDHKKLLLTLPLSDIRRPTWGQYSIDNIRTYL